VQRGAIAPGTSVGLAALLRDLINLFMFLLRAKEWTVNARIPAIIRLPVAVVFRRQSVRLGFSIPPNTFGPGLAIVHYGPIVVSGNARIGANCRTHVCVNIGGSGGLVDVETARGLAPVIGDNVYIGPGAKIFGPVRIADRCAIGANAVVNASFDEPGCSIAGVPARLISRKGSEGMILSTDSKESGSSAAYKHDYVRWVATCRTPH
jgi:serine O-acetyltransferase